MRLDLRSTLYELVLRLVPLLLLAAQIQVEPQGTLMPTLRGQYVAPPQNWQYIVFYAIALINPVWVFVLLRRSLAVTPPTVATYIDRAGLALVLLFFCIMLGVWFTFPPGKPL